MADSIALDRVTKQYGGTTAVRDLSLSVAPGEMFGLIGPDGAGKTTTIRLICGLLQPDGGSVRVLGLDPVRDHRRLTDSVGICRNGSASTAISPLTRTSRSSLRFTASSITARGAIGCSR
jgi:ABC-type multidrug transport system ATPase subunit